MFEAVFLVLLLLLPRLAPMECFSKKWTQKKKRQEEEEERAVGAENNKVIITRKKKQKQEQKDPMRREFKLGFLLSLLLVLLGLCHFSLDLSSSLLFFRTLWCVLGLKCIWCLLYICIYFSSVSSFEVY